MRVLVVPELFPEHENDARGIFLRDYVKATALRHDVCVYYTRFRSGSGQPDARHLAQTTEQYWLPSYSGYAGRLRWLLQAASHYRSSYKPDVIHAHGLGFHARVGAALSRRFRVPLVVTEHNAPFSEAYGSAPVRMLVRYNIRRAQLICVPSEWQRNSMVAWGVPAQKLVVTGNPVDTTFFSPPADGGERNTILFAGRFEENKGPLRALQAFAQISSSFPHYTMELCGDGNQRTEVEAAVHQLGLADRCIIRPFLNREDFRAALSRSCACVLPSGFESFGLTIAEALSSNVPVICDPTTGTASFQGCPGLFAASYHSEDNLAEALGQALRYSPNAAKDSASWMQLNHGFEAWCQRISQLYERL